MDERVVEPGRLIVTPHPLLVDGQRNVAWELTPGQSLYMLLMRNVPDLDGQRWEVSIGGRPVERHLWHHVFPKHGQVIEVRGGVGRAALSIVAMVALTYFTFGIAGAGGAVAGLMGGGFAGTALATGAFMAGSLLINKVLAPKAPRLSSQQQDSVYAITGARNQARFNEPLPLLFGRSLLTPDLLSKPYSWYEGNDQYVGLLLCSGINVGRIDALRIGDTPLGSFDNVQVFHAGYSQMPEQVIPLYGNADTIDGGELPKDHGWVERTTSTDTIRVQIGLEYVLGGTGTSGKSYPVTERIEVQYKAVGTSSWVMLANESYRSDRFDVRRATISRDVPQGQYDIRVRKVGQGDYEGKNTQKNDFQWTMLTSIRPDPGNYAGISRTGLQIKATGQLNGTPDQIRGVGVADPIPEWDGTAYVVKESSNPGAQCVAYARGIYRAGRLLGGMAFDDSQIDLESWKAFTLHCAANGYTYDYCVRDTRNHHGVLSAIARAGFGEITLAGGRLGVVWAAQEQPLGGVVNMGTIKKGQFQVDYNLASAADGIEFTYADPETWEAKPLQVAAPGVTTMLNPAQISGEGVTSEQHAARLARWHLAQSLYQYKDIGYSTDIEHMSYQRLSLLALQHDMTQWGFGGRVVAAVREGTQIRLTLDEPVPGRSGADAFIGLRIPGERVYRVLRVRAFTGESRELVLADKWPADAALPGDSDSNPAHDTLWIYDFKQTPGYRVRVTSIEPEDGLKGAAVRVVPEGPEFWHYVLTGDYVPPPDGSSLQTRPVASNLRITEHQVVQGDTVFTELTATFDISGPVGNVLVRSSEVGAELADVAQTTTRTATWRIPGPGRYSVVVRPFSPEGEAGGAVQGTYTTAGAGLPPVLVDLFDVEERSGGVRLYTWGWLEDSLRSPDFAGVEIRYMSGLVADPEWAAMAPVGQAGYHTAPFEIVVPDAGEWTFACRSVNTSGELSEGMRVVTKTLGKNLGQQLEETWEEAERANQRIGQEIIDRLAGDRAAINEAVGKARQYTDEQVAALNGILEDIVGADEWAAGTTYPAGDFVRRAGTLYRSLAENVDVEPGTDPAVWEAIGDYTSVGDALAAAISMSTKNASDIEAEASRVDAVVARMPAGAGTLATSAQVASEQQARADADSALGQRLDSTNAALGDKASTSSVNAVQQASVDRDNALGQRIDTTNAALEGKASTDALQQLRSEVIELDGVVDANSQLINQVRASQSGGVNSLRNADFGMGTSGWQFAVNPWQAVLQKNFAGLDWTPVGGAQAGFSVAGTPGGGVALDHDARPVVIAGENWIASAYLASHRCYSYLQLIALDVTGRVIDFVSSPVSRAFGGKLLGQWARVHARFPNGLPEGTVTVIQRWWTEGANGDSPFSWITQPMLEKAAPGQTGPSSWSVSAAGMAEATQALSVRATTLENGQSQLQASYTWALDVNGRAIGMTSVNNGTIGQINFVADRLGIVDPNNTGSTTFEGGRWVTRSGAYMMVHGKPFGVSNDLMMWIGVGSNPANASKANGLFWVDNQGNGYFGGSLSAGVLKNAVQTTSTNGNAEIINGPFSTLGRAKNVVVSYDMTKTDTAHTGRWTGVSGPVNATIAIYRKVGNGGEQFITNFNVSGSYEVLNEQGGPSQLTSRMAGSHTFTDNTPGTEQFTYRAIIVTRNVATGTPSGGPVGVAINQTLGIISVEQ
ncbi:host specificity factor TipJ family phage tail protein [Stenotrophomonas maltophilia]|uniref:Host specificity factor TipJ family phage tail protein n=1 Tax=Stenotrophomonas maltophilia TaxID=40324 RepID=A0AAJ2JAD6_STEMA|nr:host specificity factor TipJ family phage tail protein [Stenotrophomonas maltophilia]MDT3467936.1 host specificity factor TipJ family phage tail protein [Stenotrophomonas maltophilia]